MIRLSLLGVLGLVSLSAHAEVPECDSLGRVAAIGETCSDDSYLSDLLLQHPKLYQAMRKSVKRGQYPSVEGVYGTLLEERRTSEDSDEVKSKTEYQVRYYGSSGSDEIDSPAFVAVVTEWMTSDGYSWETKIKFRVTTCEKSPNLKICLE